MINLLVVGDGDRDRCTIPCLIRSILGVTVQAEFHPWARLHRAGGASGYRRQLRFAIAQAADARADGVMATVDTDRDPRRRKLKELQAAREDYRASAAPVPLALGEATPHGEAWLLDDPVAVRQGLGLPPDCQIPTVRQSRSPKETLEELRRLGPRGEGPILEALAAIAEQVDPARCMHAGETGFQQMMKDVRHELGPVASRCSGRCGAVCSCPPADTPGGGGSTP